MSDDVLNIFGKTDENQPEVPETPAKDDPAPEVEQPKEDPKGDEPAAPPAAKTEDEPRHVPYEALKDERTKRQAADRELASLRQWRADQEARQRQEHFQSIQDPDERMRLVQQEASQAVLASRMEMSRRFAEQQHGADFVDEVVNFFNDPQHAPMSHQFLRTADPFAAAVDYYRAATALREIGPDPKSYKDRLREELRAELMADLNPTKPKAPPPSMASAPSAGGDQNPIGSGFDVLFGEK